MVGLWTRGGWSHDDLVTHFHVSQTIEAGDHGYMKNHPGSGHPRVTNDDTYKINEIQAMPVQKLKNTTRSTPHTHPMPDLSPAYPELPPCSQYQGMIGTFLVEQWQRLIQYQQH